MTDAERERITAICEIAGVTEIDDLSDGFHTFRQLYYQRMMLFATIVRQNKDKAWKSLRHEDGELCFGGGWFIVGVDTPEGSYTYHYEDNYYSLFDCEILDYGKHWDGHTEKDVTRLLSLPTIQPEKAQLFSEDATFDTISRQEALEALRRCQTYLYDARDPELKIELSSAEAAISNLPTIQPEKAQLSKEGTTSDLISKTETVERLRGVLDATVPITDYDEGYVDGVEFGISTVSTMPTIQSQSTAGQLNDSSQSTVQSTDLISRQDAIDALWKALYEYEDKTEKQFQESEDLDVGDWIEHRIFVQNMNDIDRQTILNLPTAQPEPHEGHWIKHETPDGGKQYECSRCGVLWEFNDGTPEDNEAYYCPRCGTKMKGANHETD